MAEIVKKSVAIGIAGVAAVVVAAWRQIQRDNTIPDDVATATGVPVDRAPAPTAVPDTPKNHASTAPVDAKSSKADLYEVAQDLDIEGRSKMTKTELLEAIRKAS